MRLSEFSSPTQYSRNSVLLVSFYMPSCNLTVLTVHAFKFPFWVWETWWTFRIFFAIFYFFLSGEGKGKSEALGGGGGRLFIENPRRGGFCTEGGRGAGRVSAANWRIWGGGLNFFFRGRNVHQGNVKCLFELGHVRPVWNGWVLCCPTFLSVRNSYAFVLYDRFKTD